MITEKSIHELRCERRLVNDLVIVEGSFWSLCTNCASLNKTVAATLLFDPSVSEILVLVGQYYQFYVRVNYEGGGFSDFRHAGPVKSTWQNVLANNW